MGSALWSWLGFLLFIAILVALDLGVLGRGAMSLRQALWRSAFYVSLALAFATLLAAVDGHGRALAFLTAFVVEKSLSLDNLFVIAAIFGHLAIPIERQHRLLLWGVLGALAMRAALIAAGVALVAQLHWALYLFGGFLVIIGAHGLAKAGGPGRIAGGRLLDWLRRHGRVAEAAGEGLLVRHRGVLMATPAGVALLLVEAADLVFAVDSVPAVLAISTDPFIVFTANAFAILGLRALYFALAGLLPRFRYLRHGLALLLVLIGAKMLLADIVTIPTAAALAATLAVLVGAIALSLVAPRETLSAAPSRPQ